MKKKRYERNKVICYMFLFCYTQLSSKAKNYCTQPCLYV